MFGVDDHVGPALDAERRGALVGAEREESLRWHEIAAQGDAPRDAVELA